MYNKESVYLTRQIYNALDQICYYTEGEALVIPYVVQ